MNLGRRMLANSPEDQELRDLLRESGIDTSDREFFEHMISFAQERIESIQGNVKRNYELYEYFCENVLRPLLLQKPFSD